MCRGDVCVVGIGWEAPEPVRFGGASLLWSPTNFNQAPGRLTASAPLPFPSRWYAKDSYGRGTGLYTIAKDVIFKQPYLPVFRMPPSSSIKGSDPAPPATTGTNTAQCGAADCINHAGCFVDMAGGVRAVPTPALQVVNGVAGNNRWTPLMCAAAAKKNGATVFSIQVGTWVFGLACFAQSWGWAGLGGRGNMPTSDIH